MRTRLSLSKTMYESGELPKSPSHIDFLTARDFAAFFLRRSFIMSSAT